MKKFTPIFVFSIILLVGLFTFDDYGQSWDEPDIYRYGEYSLNSYQFFFNPKALPEFDTNLNLYGPAYFMIVASVARNATNPIQIWHLMYFITFLIGGYVFYLFSKRWLSSISALGITLLFVTQPLLWGHAFINPKDIPFMVFFMTSIFLGFEMADVKLKSFRQIIMMLLAGICLGLTISFRVLGPLAGVYVIVYTILKHRLKSFSYIIPYVVVALISSYLTWPYLWKAPIANYVESLKTMSDFPFDAKVLFWRELYFPTELPRNYFLTMFSLQLTEPLLFLIFLGVLSMFVIRKAEPILLFLSWFIIPAFMIMLLRSNLYDNARQLYFLIPPLFIVAGLGLEFIFTRIFLNVKTQIAVITLIILPSIFSMVNLHPYEYVHYNSRVGGVDGAYRQFETDYWSTSFKEAMEYINQNAPQNSRILILNGFDEVARSYARPDLTIVTEETDPNPQLGYDYGLILTRKNQDERRCKNASPVHMVGRGKAIFVIVEEFEVSRFCD